MYSTHSTRLASLALLSLLVAAGGCSSEPSGRQGPVTNNTQPDEPEVSGIEVASQPLDPGGSTSLTVTFGSSGSSSADAGMSTGDDSLSYEWSVSDSVWSIEGNGTSATLTAPDEYGASVTASVVVRASEEVAVRREVSVATVDNQLPQVTSLSTSPNPVQPGGTTSIEASASDGNGDELSFAWSAPEGWSLGSNSGDATEVTAPDEANASAEVTLTVSDGFGGTTTQSVALSTSRNEPPVVTSMTATPPQVEPTGEATVRVDAQDPEGDELSYSWSVPDDWSLSGEGSEVTVTAPDQFDASATIRVTLSDGNDNETTASVQLSTPANDGPTIQALDAIPKTVERGGTIDLNVSATDPDGDALSYNWSVASSDWSLQSNSSDNATLTAPAQPGVRTRVSVDVTDTQNNRSSASVLVSTQSNRAPTLAALETDPPRVEPGGTITVRARTSDPDGDSLSYDWNAPNNWSLSTPMKGVAELTAPTSYGASGTVSVTIEDGFGGQASGTTTVATVDNADPIISNLSARPNPVARGGTSTVEAIASDPNGDSLTYNWSIAGNWSSPDTSGDQIQVQAPDQYGVSTTVELVVDDGNGGSARATVTISTEGNSPPTITSLTANPPVVDPGNTSTLETIATDPNGDNLTYNWTVPNNWSRAGSGSSPSIDVTAPDQKSRSARVRVEVTDGYGGKASAAVVVRTRLNRPPVIDRLSATPASKVEPGDEITVNATVRDPDGSSSNLTYNWMLPKGWTGSSSSDSIEVTAGRNYQTQTIGLKVDDGTDTTSTSVQIDMVDNQAPSIASLTVGSNPVRLGESTTATVTASDPLGDSLSYNWSLGNNNWTQSGSGKQIQIGAPNQKSDTTVTVTVSDGFGEQASKNLTLKARRALYSFSSHTFTTCGKKTGRQGPKLSRCRSAYNPSWVGNTSYYDMPTRGYQKWTVPADGTYRIRVAGAQGGGNGGRGAIVAADVQLQRGETLLILVGQQGEETNNYGHGGGGTFVARGSDRANASPLLVAGGGGGDRSGTGLDASTSTDGVDGIRNGGSGGTNGEGGRDGGSNAGAGGGGFYTDGGEYNGGQGGHAFRNGALGGRGTQNCRGGFGGGGSCDDDDETGGGGGYSGGGGASTDGREAGGGGGSFIASGVSNVATSDGNFQDNSNKDQGYSGSVQDLGQWNTGPGSVQITKK